MKKKILVCMSFLVVSLLSGCNEAKEQIVNFESNGGTHINLQRIKNGQKVAKPNDPVKTDYTFSGWYTNSDLSGEAYNFDTPVVNDFTLFAKWSGGLVKEHYVTFNSIGGSVIPSQKVKDNEKVTTPTDPVKDGYTFEGWYVDPLYTGNSYDFNTPVKEDFTLFAKYHKNTAIYNFTFIGDNASLNNEKTYPENSKVNLTLTVTNGYHFPTKIDVVGTDSYIYNPASGTLSLTVKSNITVICKAIPNDPEKTYYICFATNGATSGLVDYQVVVEGGKAVEPTGVTKTGYTLKGWYLFEQYDDEYKFDFDTQIYFDFALYACWVANTYNVTFYDGNNELDGLVQTVKYGECVQRPETPIKEHNVFCDWYSDSNFFTKFPFSTPLTGNTFDIKVYAKYTPEIIRVTYNGNGGKLDGEIYVDIEFGKPIPNAPSISRDGYDSSKVEWHDSLVGGNKYTFGEKGTKITEPVVLYAIWPSISLLTAKFDGNGGYFENDHLVKSKEISVEYGQVPEAPIPIRDSDTYFSYTFVGWDHELSPITSYTTYVAQWEKKHIVCEITFDPNGGEITSGDPLVRLNAGETISDNSRPIVHRAGYENTTHWYTAPIGGEQFIFGSTPVTGNMILYARWENRSLHYVTFNLNDCKLFDNNQEVAVNKPVVIDVNITKSFEIRPNLGSDKYAISVFCESEQASFDYKTNIITFTEITEDIVVFASQEVKLSINDLTWKEIEDISNSGKASQYLNIGDTKNIFVNGIVHKVRIIGFDHDIIHGSDKKAGITFEFDTLLCDSEGYSLSTPYNWEQGKQSTAVDFENSTLRHNLDGGGSAKNYSWYRKNSKTESNIKTSAYDMLPNDLKSVMKTVDKTNTYVTNLFILSWYETLPKDDDITIIDNDGKIYDYYKGKNRGDYIRIKSQEKRNFNAGYEVDIEDKFNDPKPVNFAGMHNDVDENFGGDYWIKCYQKLNNQEGIVMGSNGMVEQFKSKCYNAWPVAPAFCI